MLLLLKFDTAPGRKQLRPGSRRLRPLTRLCLFIRVEHEVLIGGLGDVSVVLLGLVVLASVLHAIWDFDVLFNQVIDI